MTAQDQDPVEGTQAECRTTGEGEVTASPDAIPEGWPPHFENPCKECGLPFWVCQAIAYEAIQRGSVKKHRTAVEAEYRAGTFQPKRSDL